MSDVFFSYSNKDREIVRPVREQLSELGFDVFWDQVVPPGQDWDTWIRGELGRARCAVVFWSKTSVASRNVRHEASIASEQGKLIPALLEAISSSDFPLGHHTVQAARLFERKGGGHEREWSKLCEQIEAKVMPVWVSRRLAVGEAELKSERKRREVAETSEHGLQEQQRKLLDAVKIAERKQTEAEARAQQLATQAQKLDRQLEQAKRRSDVGASGYASRFSLQPGWLPTVSWGKLVTLAVASVVIGIVMAALGISPRDLMDSSNSIGRRLYDIGASGGEFLIRYFLLGAVIVVPIWLIARLLGAFRRRDGL